MKVTFQPGSPVSTGAQYHWLFRPRSGARDADNYVRVPESPPNSDQGGVLVWRVTGLRRREWARPELASC